MPQALAIAFDEDQVTVVRAEVGPDERAKLRDVRVIDLTDRRAPRTAADGTPGEITVEPDGPAGRPAVCAELEALLTNDIDSAHIVLRSGRAFYELLDLPFSDTRKVNQIAPLQVQDNLPFDLDEFAIETIQLHQESDENFRYLTGCVPRAMLDASVISAGQLADEARTITTAASALSGLVPQFPDLFKGSFALLEIGTRGSALALFTNDRLTLLRDFGVGRLHSADERKTLYIDIRCALAAGESLGKTQIEKVFVVAEAGSLEECERQLHIPIQALDLGPFSGAHAMIRRHSSSEHLQPEQAGELLQDFDQELSLGWALGVLAYENKQSRKAWKTLVDFGGKRPGMRNLIRVVAPAIKDELIYIVLAVAMLLTWFGSSMWISTAEQTAQDKRIAEMIQFELPDESGDPTTMLLHLRQKTSELEQRLQGVGATSTISPLDALLELTNALPPGTDIKLESLTINSDIVSLRGSVPNNPAIGSMEKSLSEHKGRLCEADVKPGERGAGNRVRFSASLKICSPS